MSKPNIFERGDGAVQLDAATIAKRVAELGAQITADYAGLDLHMVCVLNGAFVFMADLVRAIDLPSRSTSCRSLATVRAPSRAVSAAPEGPGQSLGPPRDHR